VIAEATQSMKAEAAQFRRQLREQRVQLQEQETEIKALSEGAVKKGGEVKPPVVPVSVQDNPALGSVQGNSGKWLVLPHSGDRTTRTASGCQCVRTNSVSENQCSKNQCSGKQCQQNLVC